MYFADSTGSLNSKRTSEITNIFKKYWDGHLGIHAHDNMGKAMENSITAIEKGANWVDSTVLGMGRGPGNVTTESLIIELEKKFNKKVNYSELLKLVDEDFMPMKKNSHGEVIHTITYLDYTVYTLVLFKACLRPKVLILLKY